MSKEILCKGFLAAVYEDAQGVGRQIAAEVRSKGKHSSLEDETCLTIFSEEWYLARLAWLSRRAAELTDREMNRILADEISSSVKMLAHLFEDDPLAYANYVMLADAYDRGESDKFGLRMGPGPIILFRYQNNLRRLLPKKALFFRSNPKPPEQEQLLIVALGDGACWQLEYDLGAALTHALKGM